MRENVPAARPANAGRTVARALAAGALALCAAAAAHGSAPAAVPIASNETMIRVERLAGMQRSTLELRRVVDAQSEGATSFEETSGSRLYLAPEVILTEKDVTAVFVTIDVDLHHYDVELHFADAAAQRLHDLTAEPTDVRLGFVVDGFLVASPRVMAPLRGAALIAGHWDQTQATAFAQRLAP